MTGIGAVSRGSLGRRVGRVLRGRRPGVSGVDLSTTVGSVHLRNPIMTAAGTAGYGAELAPYGIEQLGAVVVKSISVMPWEGNPAPRVHMIDAGMINSVGLQNGGIDHWLEHDLPALRALNVPVVLSIWGFSIDQYREVAERVAGVSGITAVEVNVSCPNVEDRRHMFGHSCEGTKAVISSVVGALRGSELPMWAKLSPNVTDITTIAGAAIEAGASALTLTNTVMGLVIDVETRKPVLGNGGGGMSGPAIRPVAVRAVYDCRKAFPTIPIIGVGGITRGEHVVEFMMAGANAVQIGTASFYDPGAGVRILRDLKDWCRRHSMSDVNCLVNAAHL
jgi:dihydroorotate dehydrogenase (NAD+) catalytic subunit